MDDTKSETNLAIALIGNPNTGKSTLFNALCGVRQRTGNYPGVTVERKEGTATIGGRPATIIDLPGTYSLAPRSPDEMVTVDVLLGRQAGVTKPNAVICIVDASNLERNLYLVNQVLELELPTVLALNMTDVAKKKGIEIDLITLAARVGVPVVPVQANKKIGTAQLLERLKAVINSSTPSRVSPFPDFFQQQVALLEKSQHAQSPHKLPRYLIERLLLDTAGYLESANLLGITPQLRTEIQAARERLAKAGMPAPGIEALSRFSWVNITLEGVITRHKKIGNSPSDYMDAVLTHRVWGLVAFAVIMFLMFQSVSWIAEPSNALIDATKGAVSNWVGNQVTEGPLRSLLVKGVIEGVGNVLVFLPQIFTLFFFLAILEDGGYMARAAYLMDRLMSRIGLSGKSFIPLLSSFACAIPGIMGARVIENRRDRLVTILVAPLMSCSARLPVYTLLAYAFVPNVKLGIFGLPAMVMMAMYFLGIIAAIAVASLLKTFVLKGETPPFIMELPSYKRPGLFIVLHRMIDRGFAFVKQAGTLIFAVSILIWGLTYYPHDESALPPQLKNDHAQVTAALQRIAAVGSPLEKSPAAQQQAALESQLKELENEIAGEHMRNSYLGRFGQQIEPIVKPLGWDWRIGCAAIASFPAREAVVATLGILYNVGDDADENSLTERLRDAKWAGTDTPVFNLPVALSLMVFFCLCAQCSSTLAVIRREANSTLWAIFTFVYMTGLAYVGALVTYQIGRLFL